MRMTERARTASRSELRESPRPAARSASRGNRCPGCNRPETIMSFSFSIASSVTATSTSLRFSDRSYPGATTVPRSSAFATELGPCAVCDWRREPKQREGQHLRRAYRHPVAVAGAERAHPRRRVVRFTGRRRDPGRLGDHRVGEWKGSRLMAEVARFGGTRALVTGGASGIGLATASMLAAEGAAVTVLDVAAAGPDGFHYVRADLSNDTEVREAVGAAVEALGGLDVLVNNAGIGAQGGVAANDDAEWHRVLDVNVVGMVRATRAALPALRESRHGAIVNTCSVAAIVGLPNRALYSASKGAVLSLTLAMAADLLSEGIRVNAVNPGTVDTPWVRRLLEAAPDSDAERAALEARQPHGRLVSASEVAAAICYLADPTSGSTTGTWLTVDGGMTRLRLRR